MNKDIKKFLRARTILKEGEYFDSIDDSLKSFDLGNHVVLKTYNDDPERAFKNMDMHSWNEINSIYSIHIDNELVGFVEIWEVLDESERLMYVEIQQFEILSYCRHLGYGSLFLHQLREYVSIFAQTWYLSTDFYRKLPLCWYHPEKDGWFYYPKKVTNPEYSLDMFNTFLKNYIPKLSEMDLNAYTDDDSFYMEDWDDDIYKLTKCWFDCSHGEGYYEKIEGGIMCDIEDHIGAGTLKMLFYLLTMKDKKYSNEQIGLLLDWIMKRWEEINFDLGNKPSIMDHHCFINHQLFEIFERDYFSQS